MTLAIRWLTAVAALTGVLATTGAAVAGPPTEQLRGSIDSVLKILSDAELKKEAKVAEMRRAMRSVAY